MASDLIATCLRRRAQWGWTGVWVSLAIGIPLSLVGPVVMTGLIWFTILAGFQMGVSLWGLFGICAAVMIPLEYWTEVRTRGNFLMQAIGSGRAVGTTAGYSQILDEFAFATGMTGNSLYYTYHGRGADPAGIVEMMLWGPRQVLSAFHNWKLISRFKGIDLARESTIVQKLLPLHKGVAIKELAMPGEERGNLIQAIAYLAYFDWIGVAEAEDRVWLLSEARDDLAEVGVAVKGSL